MSIGDRSPKHLDKTISDKSISVEELVEKKRKQNFQKELENNYIELENDPDFHTEVDVWDIVAGDGII